MPGGYRQVVTSTLSRPPAADVAPGPIPDDDDGEGGVGAVVRAAVGAARRAGTFSTSSIAEAIEAPVRALSRRAVSRAVAQPEPVSNMTKLADALGERSKAPLLGGATATALAAKVARRIGPLRFLARRTPMWIVAAAIPALHASITRGADELALVASHLVHRARASGVEPDPERVRRAAVQLVSGSSVDTNVEPRHATLAVAWLQRALRSTLPFASGVATRNPEGLAAAAATVPASSLASQAG